jgi:uncharacterized membrane protein
MALDSGSARATPLAKAVYCCLKAAFSGSTTYIRVYVQATKIGRSSVGLSIGRFIVGTGCYVAQIIGSVLLIFGYVAGLYLASAAMVLSFAFFISAAWLLITGIHENQV